MPKQKFCLRGKSRKHDILFACASTVLGLFVALALFPISMDSISALDDPTGSGIDISIDAPVQIDLDPLTNNMKIVKSAVTVDASSAGGYKLYLSTDTTAHQTMFLDGDSTNVYNKIDPASGTFAAPAALAFNTWGYAVAGLENFDNSYSTTNPSTSSKFANIPLTGSEDLIHEYDGSVSDDTTEVYFGARSDNTLVAGDYIAEVTYTAIPSAPPRAAKAILGNDNTLTFVYDSNTYAPSDSYTSHKGNTTISAVWDVPLGKADGSRNDYSTLGWTNRDDVYYINFDPSFSDFEPVNVSVWFYYNRKLQEITNIENFDTSKAISMERMFYGAGINLANNATMNLNLDNLQTGSVKNMSQMFYQIGKKSSTSNRIQVNFGDLSGWDVGNVTNMSNMFEQAGYLSPIWDVGDIGKWDVGEVTTMSSMFSQAAYLSTTWYCGNLGEDSANPINHPGWKPAKVTSMASMFSNAAYATKNWNIGNIGSWDVSMLTSAASMFSRSGYNSTVWNVGDIGNWKVTKLRNISSMFGYAGYNSNTWIVSNLGDLNTSQVTDMTTVFDRAGYSATTWSVGSLGYVDEDHPGWNTSNVTDMWHMFYEAAHNAEEFDIGNIGSWDTSKNKRVRAMFEDAGYSAKVWNIGKLSYVDDNHQGWTINSSVSDFAYMFDGAGYSAEDVFDVGDLGEWNMSSATDMSYMFHNAGHSATVWSVGNLGYVDVDHPGWNVSKAKDMSHLFDGAGYSATSWSIGDISSWTVAAATSMAYMFNEAGYSAEQSFDLGNLDNWNVSLVTSTSYMFHNAGHSAATTWNIGDLSGWTTIKVTNMSYMFNGAGYSAPTWDIGDLDGWDVSVASSVNYMFYNAGYSATTWNIGDISAWTTKAGVNHTNFINANPHNTNTIVEPIWN